MHIKQLAARFALSGALALAGSTAALAQDCTNVETGPGSSNTCVVTNTNTFTQNNSNDVEIDNNTYQTATSGDATVSGNTNAGDATSGDASNTSSTDTTVSINNESNGGVGGGTIPGSSNGGSNGGSGGQAGGQGGGSLGSGSSGGVGGGSLSFGSSGGVGGGALPETGSENMIDVSALRTLAQNADSATNEVAKRARGLSAGLMAAAALLSLTGAVGAAYASRKQAEV